MTQTQIDRECPFRWETQNPVTLIEHDIDRLMRLIPGLPAWAAHWKCGWDWAVSDDGGASGSTGGCECRAERKE